MADISVRGLITWAGGIIAGILLLGIAVVGSILWSLNEKVTAQGTTLIGLQTQQATMQAQLTDCINIKYNRSEAAEDRRSMLDLFAKQLERSYAQEQKIQTLSEFKAQIAERLKIGPP